MRNRVWLALAALFFAGPAIAEPVRTPPSGSTDVWYEDWCRNRLPKGLCGADWWVTD